MGHVREYTTKEVSDFLSRVGFRVDEIVYRGGHGKGLVGMAERLAPSMRPFFALVASKPAGSGEHRVLTEDGIEQRIFVVGAPRSGTTLVQGLLAAHSSLTSFTESHFFSRHFKLVPPLTTPVLTLGPDCAAARVPDRE